MKKARWSEIHAICRAVEAVAGREIRCWVEDAGDVVAGERPERYMTPCTQRVGGSDEAPALAGVDGRGSHAWIDLLATVVRIGLEQQSTIHDMASATARTWRQMNALLSMASSSSLGIEPGKSIQRIFDMLVRATRFDGGIAVVRMPGSDECVQLDASGVARVPAELLAGLEAVDEAVRTFPEGAEPDIVHEACSALLDPYKPAAVGRLQTDHELFGWLVAASADPLSSDDLKLFGAAARIIGVALENAQTLTLVREAARADVEREFYGTLAKAAPVGMFRTDAEGRTLYVNHRWCAVTGISEDEALRDGWLSAVHDEDLARVTSDWECMLVEGKAVRCEHRCRDEANETWVLTEIAREAKDDGGFVGTMSDITDRKRTEHEKGELELHLRHAQKMEAVGTMAGGIAHDFNNLLGAIVGNAELAIGRVPEGDRARVHLDRLLQGAFRARDLVSQMLAFSRQTESVRVAQEVAPVVEETLALIRASVPANVVLRATVAHSGCNVRADATQLHQVVLNLCTNAYQAVGTEAGEVDVQLESVEVDAATARSLASAAQPGRYARLSVIDTGPGVSEEVRGRVFEPFFTTKAAGGGSGLGLAVVHGVVTDHGGFIHVDNEPGRGARFDVYLPIHDARATSERTRKAAASWASRWGDFTSGGSQPEPQDGPAPDAGSTDEAPLPNELAATPTEGVAATSALVPRARATPPAVPPVWPGPQAEALSDPEGGATNGSLEDLVASFLAVQDEPPTAQPGTHGEAAGALVARPSSSPARRSTGHVAVRSQPPRVLPQPSSDGGDDRLSASSGDAGDESALERLVADFLATEQSPVRRYNEAAPSASHGAIQPAVARKPHSTGTTLPAVRGSRVPARTRLLERAPEVQRGAVKLLGSSKARRLEHDRPRALPGASTDTPAASTPVAAAESAQSSPDISQPPAAAAALPEQAAPAPRKLFFPFMIG